MRTFAQRRSLSSNLSQSRRLSKAVGSALVEPLEGRVLLSSVVVNTWLDQAFQTTNPGTGFYSLRDAINIANNDSTVTQITFDPKIFAAATAQTINLTAPLPMLTAAQQIDIVGPPAGVILDAANTGATFNDKADVGIDVSGNGNSAMSFAATVTDATVSNITIENASLTIGGNASGTIEGAGIYNLGIVSLDNVSVGNCTITDGNGSTTGGGIYNGTGATLSLTDGNVTDCTSAANSDATNSYGGAIYNNGVLNLTNVTVSGNCTDTTVAGAKAAGGNAAGGSIYNDVLGTATLNNVQVTNSTVHSAAAKGSASYGGGIFNGGILSLTVVDVTLSTATAGGEGGGIYNAAAATLTADDVAITNTDSDGPGAGISNWGTATIGNATIANNTAGGTGGGINNAATGIQTLLNVTIANNSASQFGGGIYNAVGGVSTLINGTLVDNQEQGGNGTMAGGGGIANLDPTEASFTIANTIVAANTVANNNGAGYGVGNDTYGNFTSLGNNLIGDTYGSLGNGSSSWTASDYVSPTPVSPLNPDLYPLATTALIQAPSQATLFNNPFLKTMLPQPGSVAVDHGCNTIAVSTYGLNFDQLGNPRVVNGTVDIGAAEVQGNLTVAAANTQEAMLGVTGNFTLGNFTEYEASAPYTVNVDWGDGTTPSDFLVPVAISGVPTTIPAQQHQYNVTGNETVTVTVTDTFNGTTVGNTATFIIDVADITVTPPANQDADAGQATPFTLGSFTQTNATGPFTATINWGDGSGNSTVNIPAAGSLGNLTHTFTTAQNFTVTETVADADNHISSPVTFTVDVGSLTVAPPAIQIANTGQSTPINLGNFSQVNTSGPYTITVNWGDTPLDISIFSIAGGGATTAIGNISHTYTSTGNWTGNITVTDTDNHTSNTGNFTVDVATIAGVAPANQFANVGQSESFKLGRFVQTNATGAYKADVNWGDGSPDTIVTLFAGNVTITSQNHKYTSAGNETVTITVTDSVNNIDKSGNHSSINNDTFTVDVGSLIVSAPGTAQNANTGCGTLINLGVFQAFNCTAPYTATVDWGDGAVSIIGNMTATGAIPAQNHTYTLSGNYTGNITLTDSATHTSNTSSFTVDVATVSMLVTPPPSQDATAGIGQAFILGNFNEMNATGPYLVAVNWGDGSAFSDTTVAAPGAIGNLTHTYTAAGNETASLTVTDSAGHSSTAVTFTIAVGAITVTPASNQAVTAAESYAFNFGTFTQIDAAGPFTVVVNWGDGSGNSTSYMPAAGTIPGQNHTYATSGIYTVSLTLTDAAGRNSGEAFAVSVIAVPTVLTNLSPASSIGQGTATVTFSGTISGDNGTLIPPGNETVAITLGTVTQNAAIAANGNFSTTFVASQLPASTTAYAVTYAYAGDATFAPASNTTSTALSVTGFQEPVYRLYSPVTMEHLYTSDVNEYNVLKTYGWNQEGLVFKWWNGPIVLNGETAVPVYRLYNTSNMQHFWTTSLSEYTTLGALAGTWNAEGIAGYVLPTAGVPGSEALYCLSYPTAAGLHLWTTDQNEVTTLENQDGWLADTAYGATNGIIGYVL